MGSIEALFSAARQSTSERLCSVFGVFRRGGSLYRFGCHLMLSMVARMVASLSSVTMRDFRVVRLGRSSRRVIGLDFAVFETGAGTRFFFGAARRCRAFDLPLFIELVPGV
jgi:hypothetical protein